MGSLWILKECLTCPQRNLGSENFLTCPHSHSCHYVAVTPASARYLVPTGTHFPVWKWEYCLLPCRLIVRVKLGNACAGILWNLKNPVSAIYGCCHCYYSAVTYQPKDLGGIKERGSDRDKIMGSYDRFIWFNCCVHLYNKNPSKAYKVHGTMIGSGDTAVNKTGQPPISHSLINK